MDIKNAYNEWSGIYDTNENLTRDLDQQVTRDTWTGQRFNSILEIGCGTGKNTVFLVEIGSNVHALDFSQGMIMKAWEKVKAGNARFETADLMKPWPCENDMYDLITCNLVLEHITDLIRLNGYEISWIDSSIITEKPKLAPYIEGDAPAEGTLAGSEADASASAITRPRAGFGASLQRGSAVRLIKALREPRRTGSFSLLFYAPARRHRQRAPTKSMRHRPSPF